MDELCAHRGEARVLSRFNGRTPRWFPRAAAVPFACFAAVCRITMETPGLPGHKLRL
jgi:hypothetical protein